MVWTGGTRRLCTLSAALLHKLDHYSQFTPSSLSMQHFMDFGRKGSQQQSFLFLRHEVPVRLANIMKELQLLPAELLATPSAGLVQHWYTQSFEDMLAYEHVRPPRGSVKGWSEHDVQLHGSENSLKICFALLHCWSGKYRFTDTLDGILKRHSGVVETMAEGLMELKHTHGVDIPTQRNLQYFLDRFYLNRISIRMLLHQHLMLFGAILPEHPRHIGAIDPRCNVQSVVCDAYESARFLCDQYYMSAPEVRVNLCGLDTDHDGITVAAVPSHVYHMCFELIKNAMRAVVEKWGVECDLPPIDVNLVNGTDDLTIKISDLGGGVARDKVDMMFHYMFSTAPPPPKDAPQPPLAGYGYGLPLSRLYARYFGGDLMLVSAQGSGTDALIYLKQNARGATEWLPVYSSSAKRHYTQSEQAPDWTNGQCSGGKKNQRMKGVSKFDGKRDPSKKGPPDVLKVFGGGSSHL